MIKHQNQKILKNLLKIPKNQELMIKVKKILKNELLTKSLQLEKNQLKKKRRRKS
jgi:hypothetical protein